MKYTKFKYLKKNFKLDEDQEKPLQSTNSNEFCTRKSPKLSVGINKNNVIKLVKAS